MNFTKYNALLCAMLIGLTLICIIAANREYGFAGSMPIFAILMLSAFGLAFLTGYPLTSFVTMCVVILAYDHFDSLKYDLVRTHIQIPDIHLISSFLLHMDFSIIILYKHIIINVVLSLVLIIGLTSVSYLFEKRYCHYNKIFTKNMPAFILITLTLTSSVSIFLSSNYISGMKHLQINSLVSDARPIRASLAILGISEYVKLYWKLSHVTSSDNPIESATSPTLCNGCPDLIVVHLESVFDPALVASYANKTPISELLAPSASSYHGALKVNIWGGFSWITEFEIICGLNHKLFGWAGQYTHYNISPFLRGCIPNELKKLNYQTEAIYTAPRSFINVGAAFSIYGIDKFSDSHALNLPKNSKHITDAMMVVELLEKLRQDSNKPRLIWLSTTWNHGPHGARFAKRDYAGPYDQNRAQTTEMRDYVNRLNHTLSSFADVTKYVMNTKRPTAVLFYGDHHPYFQKTYDEKAINRYHTDLDFITALAFMKNFPDKGTLDSASAVPRVVKSESVFRTFLQFAGVPESAQMVRLKEISRLCGGDQSNCTKKLRKELLSAYLRN